MKAAVCASALLILLSSSLELDAQSARFQRGDANLDGAFDISDGIFTVRMIFLGDTPPGCDDAADMDDDGQLGVTDAIFAMRFLFRDGNPPPVPFDSCGVDPSEDLLRCDSNPTCGVEIPCLSQQGIDEILEGLPELAFSFCIPAGAIDLPADPFQVSICPAADARPCGAAEQPGCPVEITSVTGVLSAKDRRIALRFAGQVVDLPISVTESVFNTTTTCLTAFHGKDSKMPFSFEIAIPLLVEESDGALRITGVGESGVENVDLALTSAGGLVCRLFQAGQAAFIDLLAAPLDQAAKALTQGFTDQLVGLSLCVEE